MRHHLWWRRNSDATADKFHEVSDTDPLPVQTTDGGTTNTALAAATPAAVKASAGRLGRVLVTATGTAAGTFYDNASAASGTKLFIIPANAAVGSFYVVDMPAANGIYFDGIASGPAVTVSFA